MTIDFSTQILIPAYNVFARPVTFTPTASQPSQPSYDARGIYDSQAIEVMTEGALMTDARTILDIREIEFSVLPAQGDTLVIPAIASVPEAGTFEVVSRDSNGGGETTLSLRRIMTSRP